LSGNNNQNGTWEAGIWLSASIVMNTTSSNIAERHLPNVTLNALQEDSVVEPVEREQPPTLMESPLDTDLQDAMCSSLTIFGRASVHRL